MARMCGNVRENTQISKLTKQLSHKTAFTPRQNFSNNCLLTAIYKEKMNKTEI